MLIRGILYSLWHCQTPRLWGAESHGDGDAKAALKVHNRRAMGGVVPDNTEGHEWVGVQTGRLESKSFKKRPEGGVNMANDLVSLYIPKQRN